MVDSWSRGKAKYRPPESNYILVARFPHRRGYLIFFYLILQLSNTTLKYCALSKLFRFPSIRFPSILDVSFDFVSEIWRGGSVA